MNIIISWARTQWDRVLAWVLVAMGALAVVLGWNGVSGEPLTAQQIPYLISGGIGGLFFLGLGAMLWLSADLRDEWRRLDAIERNTRGLVDMGEVDGDPFAASVEPEPSPGDATPTRRKPLVAR